MEKWMNYECDKFIFEDHEAIVVKPQTAVSGYLAIKTEYWSEIAYAIELGLLENGFHLCYIKNDNRWGVPEDLDRKARFVRFVQKQYGLHQKCVPIGMSCGGLIAIKFAARYPELVQCMYLDAPVVNYMSCPCGFGIRNRCSADSDYSEILNALRLNSLAELMAYRDMPLDHLDTLVKNRLPVVMVAGDSDITVPYHENGVFLEQAYKDADVDIEVYIKPGCGHHPHGLENSQEPLDFILRHCYLNDSKEM